MLWSSIKTQAIMHFIGKFSSLLEICNVGVGKPEIWQVFVNSAHNFKGTGLGVVILYHKRNYFEYFVRMDFLVTNTIAKYEEVIFRVMILNTMGLSNLILHKDSQLVDKTKSQVFILKFGQYVIQGEDI